MSDDYEIIVDGNVNNEIWSHNIICDKCCCIYRTKRSKLIVRNDKIKGKCFLAFCPCCNNTTLIEYTL